MNCESARLAPLIYLDDEANLHGFDYELVQSFADYLGVKLIITMRPTVELIFDDIEEGMQISGLLVCSIIKIDYKNENWAKLPKCDTAIGLPKRVLLALRALMILKENWWLWQALHTLAPSNH